MSVINVVWLSSSSFPLCTNEGKTILAHPEKKIKCWYTWNVIFPVNSFTALLFCLLYFNSVSILHKNRRDLAFGLSNGKYLPSGHYWLRNHGFVSKIRTGKDSSCVCIILQAIIFLICYYFFSFLCCLIAYFT